MTENSNDPNAPSAILANVALAALMPISVLVAPLFIGQLINELKFSAPQAGYLLSIELATMCLATVVALLLMRRVAWPRIVAGCLIVAMLGNIGSAFAPTFTSLALLRIFTGLGSGTIMAMCLAAIGASRAKDRNFAYWLISQLLSGVVGLLILSWVFQTWGLAGFFLGVAGCQAALLLTARYFFDGRAALLSRDAQDEQPGRVAPAAVAVLVAILLIYVAIGGVWAYVERIGQLSAIATGTIGTILAIATGMGIVGAATASIIGGRFSRTLPMIAGFAIVMGSMTLLLNNPPVLRYAIAAGMFKFAWTFLIPFMLASISARDPSSRLIIVSNFVLGGGLALGPAVGALILRASGSYDLLIVIMLAVSAASAVICLVPQFTGARTIGGLSPA